MKRKKEEQKKERKKNKERERKKEKRKRERTRERKKERKKEEKERTRERKKMVWNITSSWRLPPWPHADREHCYGLTCQKREWKFWVEKLSKDKK